MLEAALGVFFRSAGRLHDAVQGHEFTDDELAHDVTARLEAIPMKRVLQFEIAVKLSVVYIHHLVWRV